MDAVDRGRSALEARIRRARRKKNSSDERAEERVELLDERESAQLAQAGTLISALFGKGKAQQPAKPSRLTSQLEEIFRIPRAEWSPAMLRGLWTYLSQGITRRNRSLVHETNWLSVTGFALRPGYGVAGDPERMRELWRLRELGLAHRKELRAWVQWWILWRRVSSGLDAVQQQQLWQDARKAISKKEMETVEAYRLLGSLERVTAEERAELFDQMAKQFSKGKLSPETAWAFGRLGSRVQLAKEVQAIPAVHVEAAWELLRDSSWQESRFQALIDAFLLAARVPEHPEMSIAPALRADIYERFSALGVDEARLEALRSYLPLKRSDQSALFGEALPLGLHILED